MKKEPSVRWLRVGRENSNNFSLKKSTTDTLLLRTYKQTELLCTHIKWCSALQPWLWPHRAWLSHVQAQNSAGLGAQEHWIPRACSSKTFTPGLSGACEGQRETSIQARTGVPLTRRPSRTECVDRLTSVSSQFSRECYRQTSLVPRRPTSHIIKRQKVTL